MSKRVLSMLLAFVMTIGMLQGALTYASAAISVSTSSDGTVLTIFGEGVISKDSLNDVDKEKVTAIIIKAGINRIGNNAFENYSNVKTITIEGGLSPESMSYNAVGQYAFRNCGALTDIYYYGEKTVTGSTVGLGSTVKVHVLETFAGTFCGKSNGNLTKDLTETIDASGAVVILEETEYTYTGEAITPAVTVALDGKTFAKDTDYTIAYDSNINAGENAAKVIVTFQGKYKGEIIKTFTIKKAERGEITLSAPVESVLPGDVIHLAVSGDTKEPGEIEAAGKGFTYLGDLKIKINDGLVAGEDKVEVTVTYKETANITGATSNTIELKIGMSGSSVDEEALKALEDAIAELQNLIAKKADTEDIADQLEGITNQIANLDDSYTTDAELVEIIEEVNTVIDALEAELKDQLKDEIDAVKALITGIDEKVDIAEAAIDALEAAIEALKAADVTNADDLTAAITDLNAAIDTAKITAANADEALEEKLNTKIEAADQILDAKIAKIQENLDKTVEELKKADATNAADLQNAIANLNAAIDTAKATATKADADLQNELNQKIEVADQTLDAKIAQVRKNLEEAVKDLETAIKDGDNDLQAQINVLTEAREAAEAASAAADAALQAKIDAANALINSLDNRVTTVEGAIEDLNEAIEALKDAVANIDQELYEEIDALAVSIEAAKTALKKADADNKAVLEDKIKEAQNSLQAAIETVQENLDQAIKALEEADEANAEALEKAINRLNKAIADAEAAAKDADAKLEKKLNKKIEDANKELNKKIEDVQKNLEKAKKDLEKAIADGDKALDDKITKLNDAMNAADTALKTADAALKKQLEEEIKAANALIDSLEARVDTAEDAIKALEKAVEELKKVDAANAEAMKAAIEDLNKAIVAAKAFAEKSDAELKDALNEKINAAQTALEAKIAEIQANLDKAVEALKAVDQANAEKLADAVARLKEAIAAAEAASAATDVIQDEHIIALKNEIDRVARELEKAQANLEAALKSEIETLTAELKRAEEALKNAIDTKADEDAVNAAIAKLQNEIAALEAAKNNYIAADAALKAEVEAAIAKAQQEAIDAAKGHIPYIGENGNWWIGDSDTGVDANGIQGATGKDGITPQLRVGSGNIWEVSYDNGKTWTSLGVSAVGASGSNGKNGRDGADGKDGKDGITPKLRINEDTNMWEVSYDEGKTWESLGVVATGADGANGADGMNGITPQLRINEKTNMWEVSYDDGATWTSMGVEATGTNGSSSVLPLVLSGVSLAGLIAMVCIMLVDRKKRGLPVG